MHPNCTAPLELRPQRQSIPGGLANTQAKPRLNTPSPTYARSSGKLKQLESHIEDFWTVEQPPPTGPSDTSMVSIAAAAPASSQARLSTHTYSPIVRHPSRTLTGSSPKKSNASAVASMNRCFSPSPCPQLDLTATHAFSHQHASSSTAAGPSRHASPAVHEPSSTTSPSDSASMMAMAPSAPNQVYANPFGQIRSAETLDSCSWSVLPTNAGPGSALSAPTLPSSAGRCLDALIPDEDGLAILQSYFDNVTWMLDSVDHTLLQETLEQAGRHGCAAIHPHRLACLFLAMALGDHFSCSLTVPNESSRTRTPSPQHSAPSWFSAASACLFTPCLQNNVVTAPTVDACAALHLMVAFMHLSGDAKLSSGVNNTIGLALRLAHSLGLDEGDAPGHPARLPAHRCPPETLRGSRTYRELLVQERFLALELARPQQVEVRLCRYDPLPQPLPFLPHDNVFGSAYSIHTFHRLKHRFSEFIAIVFEQACGPRRPSYPIILEVDDRIRRFESAAPAWLLLRNPLPADMGRYLDELEVGKVVRQRHSLVLLVHKLFFTLHRPYFFAYLRSSQHVDPVQRESNNQNGEGSQTSKMDAEARFEASFVATVNSATWITAMYSSILDSCPGVLKLPVLTQNAFSAAMVQVNALLHCPDHRLGDRVRADLVKNAKNLQIAAATQLCRLAQPASQIVHAFIDLVSPRGVRTMSPHVGSKSQHDGESATSVSGSQSRDGSEDVDSTSCASMPALMSRPTKRESSTSEYHAKSSNAPQRPDQNCSSVAQGCLLQPPLSMDDVSVGSCSSPGQLHANLDMELGSESHQPDRHSACTVGRKPAAQSQRRPDASVRVQASLESAWIVSESRVSGHGRSERRSAETVAVSRR
ncbi:hypothetical protein BCV70DRAFT_208291 [Testicularia cyperi]|uniref:Xylanolytic transcriptional activator regulatory domain-containing protein n=1 Tax=Testicularia cyperi TaxID=1882483 RepID=A0A317XIU1_9BASI|nr:hypothetical protein BCV70DRAFT_208291 [Testicularia cyperi]